MKSDSSKYICIYFDAETLKLLDDYAWEHFTQRSKAARMIIREVCSKYFADKEVAQESDTAS